MYYANSLADLKEDRDLAVEIFKPHSIATPDDDFIETDAEPPVAIMHTNYKLAFELRDVTIFHRIGVGFHTQTAPFTMISKDLAEELEYNPADDTIPIGFQVIIRTYSPFL